MCVCSPFAPLADTDQYSIDRTVLNRKSLIAMAITAGGLGAPQSVLAEPTVGVGATPPANAGLNFRVIIPSIITFRVGCVGDCVP